MTAQELRASLLQEAVTGRLVPQRAEEGSAEPLYEEIQQEKARLIAEKKIKKEKPLPPVTEEGQPFPIPVTWKWVRWGDISFSIQYGYNAPAKPSGNIKMVRISDIQKGKVQWATVPFCNIDKKDISNYLLQKDDLLFARTGGTVGKSFLVETVPEHAVFAGYLIRTQYSKKLSPHYLKFFMESSLYWTQLKKGTIATAQPNCNGQTLAKMMLPLPPLAEQKRIVDKLEELLPLVDAYGEAEQRLAAYEARFPDALKQSLLQEAVTGRLVPQRAEEGSAETLYEEIRQEKARLVAEKKIKKEKPLPPVTEEEQPFPIPATWKWIRLGNCGNWYSGTTPSRTRPDYYGGSIPWLKTGDLNDGLITNTSEKITELACKETSVHLNPAGAVLIAMYGATIGRLGLLSMESTTNQACCACTTYSGVFNKFLFFFLLAWRPNFIKQGAGGAQPNISKEKIINTPFPLPPLAEQKRIVDKLEELLALAEHIHEARR